MKLVKDEALIVRTDQCRQLLDRENLRAVAIVDHQVEDIGVGQEHLVIMQDRGQSLSPAMELGAIRHELAQRLPR